MNSAFKVTLLVTTLALAFQAVSQKVVAQENNATRSVAKESELASDKKPESGNVAPAKATEEEAGETAVELESVPSAVQSAIKAAAGPQGKITKVVKESDEGAEAYEADVAVGGVEKSVKVTADGHVVEIEEKVQPDQVPATIQAVVKKAVPGGKIKEALAVTEHYYEFEVVEDGKVKEVKVSLLGKADVEDESSSGQMNEENEAKEEKAAPETKPAENRSSEEKETEKK
ncbi:MAG: hypothetical protein D6691_05405 [Candidatus Hydrogenedentota bacterium]|jgi:hypothetical protein|uniref:PepSY domain-containing protein n=1 Tax=Sumerlaea chitinivorans TaxID=2250252 RepID=A0A2Z4Y5S1_SUMC1|nr:hypothetical protein BRCON_1275 [Candidatus Sumerlaea chitinivorans]MCX7964729.1 hypothetical protein [Candidatus Sumerlaea chitinivorans]RMH27896.1 MAG: hypothetical protein D6691_05405 [Candidatus Hydrogenedentota bacterium]GIX43992.1 MAG: hypothetical protein KatS3mg130_0400 [Candidatus Sumerlaea sp.]